MMARTLVPQRFRARTVPALLCETARRIPGETFLRFVEGGGGAPRDLTFAEFRRGVGRAAAILADAGVGPGDRVLLVAENSPEWQMVAIGAQLLRAEPAAAFASLSPEAVQALALRVRPRAMLVSTRAQWEKLAPAGAALAEAGLARVLCGEPLADLPRGVVAEPLSALAGEIDVDIDVAALERQAAQVREDDPFLLLFTSGTTGRPKGVRLPQRSIVHAVDGGTGAVGTSQVDRGLHFLPFAHVAGHDQFVLALAEGH